MTLIAYAGKEPDRPYMRLTAASMGYTPEFIERARSAVTARTRQTEFNQQGLLVFRNRGMPEWARQIVAEVCSKHMVFISDIAGMSRRHKVVRARNEAIYRVKANKPSLSSTQMANWFDRDHVSILYAIASHSHATGDPMIVGYDLSRVREQNKKRAADRMRRLREAT